MEDKTTHAKPALVFVYNADSGVFNTLTDAAHKIFSPRTYACNLCALTHTAFRVRGEWKRFLEGLGRPLEFLHADELRSRYGLRDVPLPAAFEKDGASLRVAVSADEINACGTLEELKRLILDASNSLDEE
jgi:hypothetical protein